MNIDLSQLTPEQRKALADEALKAEREAAQKRDADRKAYKDLISEKVEALFPKLQILSEQLTVTKAQIYNEFSQALQMKAELYEVPEDQNCHSFINKGATERITLGSCVKDNYDDTVNEGIAKVKGFISSLARDAESQMLVKTILKLLSRDQKGNLKASKVMQLRQMAEESGDDTFLDGVRIIEKAYKPIQSKTFVRAEYKNAVGEWVNIPLGMTEA